MGYSQRGVLKSRYEDRKGKPKITEDDILAARFRVLMTSQSEFGNTYEEETPSSSPTNAQKQQNNGGEGNRQPENSNNSSSKPATAGGKSGKKKGGANEGQALAALAVKHMFDNLQIDDICPEKELDECIEICTQYMDDIDNVFKYYAGFGAGGAATLISRTEFHHFISHTHVFDDHATTKTICDSIFEDANKNLTPRALGGE